jgi:hypothetical protein
MVIPAAPARTALYGLLRGKQDRLGAGGECEGSRMKFMLHGEEWHAHRPHPGKEAKKYQVEQVRELLNRLEIHP